MQGRENGSGKRKRPRTCVGCGEEFPRKDLVRIVRTPSGDVVVDDGGRSSGRGVYLCRKTECVMKAQKRNALARSLRVPVPKEIWDSILELVRREEADQSDD
jgi:uncharacterized protein